MTIDKPQEEDFRTVTVGYDANRVTLEDIEKAIDDISGARIV